MKNEIIAIAVTLLLVGLVAVNADVGNKDDSDEMHAGCMNMMKNIDMEDMQEMMNAMHGDDFDMNEMHQKMHGSNSMSKGMH